MQRLTIDEIKIKFPNPVRGGIGEYDENAYCVGGAFINSAWPSKYFRFPMAGTLATRIKMYREFIELPEIPWEDLRLGVDEVIRQNDLGRFDTAWHLLGDLIS